MDPDKDDEITIDFSKIKRWFSGKEKDKVKTAQEKAEAVEKRIEPEPDKDKFKKDDREVHKIEQDLKKEENEAMIIDGERKIIEKKVHTQEEKIEKDADDEDFSFDFSKIKNIFKFDKKQSKEDDDISIDFHQAGKLIKKYNIFLLLLIPIFISIYLRAMPAYLPITEDWAQSTLINMNRDIISQQLRQQYPNLPAANLNQLVNNELQKLIDNDQILVPTQQGVQQAPYKDMIKQQAGSFKERLQKDGQTYLLAIDPYFWMRHAKNILENGHPGDELRDINTKEPCDVMSTTCVPWNTHMYAPLGRPVPPDMFNAYLEAYLHKVISIFSPGQQLMSTAFWIPVILSALAVIPAFFITRRIAGNFGGLVAALIVALHPAFITRTAGGFADTDAYNVLFPLMITWLFLEAFEAKNWKKSIILSALAGLFVGFYTITWPGWWYILDFLIVSLVGFVIIYLLINRDKLQNITNQRTLKITGMVFITFALSSFIFGLVISSYARVANAWTGPSSFINLKEVGISVWPNVFTTVAEQNSASLNNVVNQIGMNSIVLFLLALIGIALTLTKLKKMDRQDIIYIVGSIIFITAIVIIRPQNLFLFLVLLALPIIVKLFWAIYVKDLNIDFKLAVILIIWFLSTLYASTKGVRFLLLLVPAFAIGLGISFGTIYRYVSRGVNKYLDLNKTLSGSVIILLLLLLLITPFNTARATAKNEIPSMNDAWYESLDKINRESSPDAIINSWWDFGHWFKYVGDRAVTFDGTSQNTPMAHWIGSSLLTNDEDKAIGILRMLDCGSNTAFEKLEEDIQDTAKSVSILQEVVALDKEDAKEKLMEYVDEDKADEVLEFTHCDPPENYYITSDDMIGKSGVWGHFGIWNFDRALIYNTLRKAEYRNDKQKSIDFLKERFNYTDDQAETMYFDVRSVRNSDEANSWIAPWPSYASGQIGCQNNDENSITCPVPINPQQSSGTVPLTISFKNKTAIISTTQGEFHPNAVVYPTEDGIEKISYSNQTIGFGLTLIPSGDSWNFVMMQSPLEDSMFTRLYFLGGHGLSHFDSFSTQRSVVGNRIYVWKVDWEGDDDNLVYFQEPEQNEDAPSQTDLDSKETDVVDNNTNTSDVLEVDSEEDVVEMEENTDNGTSE